jgi:hypothetical protein
MKVIFVLDDMSVFVSTPEELQLRQIKEGISAIVAPAGKNEDGEDTFIPLISYPVYLSSNPLPEGFNPNPPVEVTPVPAPKLVKKAKAKKKAEA